MTTADPPVRRAVNLEDRADLEALARAGQQAVYLGDDTALCRVLGKHLCYVDTRDRALAPHLLLNGCWEPWITLAIGRLLRPGMICIDVGANLGYFTLLMADLVGPAGAVVAFEPNPRLCGLARSSLYASGFRDRTCLSEFAAADRDGAVVELSFDAALPMNGTIVGGSRPGSTPVKTVRLDTACGGLPRLDLVKIDVEGAEEAVWDGMQDLLDRHAGACVVLEWNAQRPNAERLLDKIAARYAQLRHIEFDGSVAPITKERLLKERGHEDFMLFLRNG